MAKDPKGKAIIEISDDESSLSQKSYDQSSDDISSYYSSTDDDYDSDHEGSFEMTMRMSHVNYPQLDLPRGAAAMLPKSKVDVILRNHGFKWLVTYSGDPKRPKFGCGWGEFVADNGIREGERCIFEYEGMRNGTLTFNVDIIPPN